MNDNVKVIHINDNSKSSDLYMNYCGSSACEPDHSFGPAMRDHYVLHYILSGKGVLTIGNKKYELSENQGFLLCPGVISRYKADHKEPWEYVWVGFNGLNAATYLKHACLNEEEPVFSYDRDSALKDCMLEMVNTNDTYKFAPRLKLQSLLYLLFSILVENTAEKTGSESIPLQQTYIQKAISYIQMNYMEESLTVSALADYVGLDRSYLCSLFKKYLNTPPRSYISQYRVNRACELLKGTSCSINDVSGMIGYKDPVVFQKFFKKYVGMAPSKYRKKN